MSIIDLFQISVHKNLTMAGVVSNACIVLANQSLASSSTEVQKSFKVKNVVRAASICIFSRINWHDWHLTRGPFLH